MSAAVSPDKPVFEKIASVVIIYDDLARATKANAMMERAFHRAGEVAPGNVKPWRLDLLNLPPLAAEALKDTADAHLIVFALRPAQSPPTWLLDWLEQWARSRRIGEAALAVFSGSADASPAPAARELPKFAERHGLNFILDTGGSAQDESTAFARELHEREISATPDSEENMDESAHQHWGINE